MDKKLLFSAILLLISASYASAESITASQQEYWLGEAVYSEISMQNFDLAKLSFTDNKTNKIPVGFILLQADNKQMVYFDIPTSLSAGDYYLRAKDQRVINGVLQDFELSTKMPVSENLGLSVDPPVLKLDPANDEIKISLRNNAEKEVTVNITSSDPSFNPARNPLQIGPKETKNAFISYNYSEITSNQEIYLTYSNRTYTVRALLPKEEQTKQPTSSEIPSSPTYAEELKFEAQKTVEKQASRYTAFSDTLTVRSTARKELHNVRFSLTGSLKNIAELQTTTVETLPAEGTIDQYVWVNKDKKASPGLYEGELIVNSDEGYSDSIHFKITLEDLKITEQNITNMTAAKPNIALFNRSSLSMLINETKAQEKPDIKKNVTIAMVLLATVLFIAFLIGRKLRIKTRKRQLEEYVHSLKKGHKQQ